MLIKKGGNKTTAQNWLSNGRDDSENHLPVNSSVKVLVCFVLRDIKGLEVMTSSSDDGFNIA